MSPFPRSSAPSYVFLVCLSAFGAGWSALTQRLVSRPKLYPAEHQQQASRRPWPRRGVV